MIRTRKRSADKNIKTHQKKIWKPALLSWNPESSTRNPESTVWNPKSKTLLDSLTWGENGVYSLKQELQSARNSSSVREPQHPDPPQQQSTRVSSHSLSSIHSRYNKVLQTMKDNNCSMANAYRLSGCPRSTLQDFITIAELKKVDTRAFEIALANYQGESES